MVSFSCCNRCRSKVTGQRKVNHTPPAHRLSAGKSKALIKKNKCQAFLYCCSLAMNYLKRCSDLAHDDDCSYLLT